MSLQGFDSLNRSLRKHGSKLATLANAEGYPRWMRSVSDAAFGITGKPDISRLEVYETLAKDYFKGHKDFKAQYNTNSKDEDRESCDPFIQDPSFGKKCLDHALYTGYGMEEWAAMWCSR